MYFSLVMVRLWSKFQKSPHVEEWRLLEGATYKRAVPILIKVSKIMVPFSGTYLGDSAH